MENKILDKIDDLISEFIELEKYYRVCMDEALDIKDITISDIEIAKYTNKIRSVKQCKNEIEGLKIKAYKEFIGEKNLSNTINNEINILKNNNNESEITKIDFAYQEQNNIDDEIIEETKIGQYVRGKMRELCDNGYKFNGNTLSRLLSHTDEKLGFSIPMFKMYNDEKNISEQIKVNNYNRYWKEIFDFGNIKLLICSQWIESNRDAFDEFYENLLADNEEKINEVYRYNTPDIPAPHKQNDNLPIDYSNTNPTSIALFGETMNVRFWNEVLIKVCNEMVLRKSYIIAQFDKNEELNPSERINFSYIESEVKFNSKRLTNGLWVETNRSANDIVKVCKKILQICGYQSTDLVIEFNK